MLGKTKTNRNILRMLAQRGNEWRIKKGMAKEVKMLPEERGIFVKTPFIKTKSIAPQSKPKIKKGIPLNKNGTNVGLPCQRIFSFLSKI